MYELLKPASLIDSLKKEWQQLPIVVRRFITRALLLSAFWFIGYNCFLQPEASVDNLLTKITTEATTYTLNHYYVVGFTMQPYKPVLEFGGRRDVFQVILFQYKSVLSIGHPCNAQKLYALYLGFLLCVPGTIKKKVVYSFFGIAIIFVLNVLRCHALAWLNMNKPEWTDFAHHYVFATIVYTIIFLLWVSFLKKTPINEA